MANNLRRLRNEKKMFLSDLAQRSSINEATLSRIQTVILNTSNR
jgi:DNA-binding Xre family transcriptional regulator